MNLLIFYSPYEFFQFFYVFQNTIFEKKIETTTMQFLRVVQSLGKFLCVIWNRVTKQSKILNVTFIFQHFQKNFHIGKSRQLRASRLFSKTIEGKVLNFLHEVEKMISVISVQVYSKKLDFPSLKKIPYFQETNFLFKVFLY